MSLLLCTVNYLERKKKNNMYLFILTSQKIDVYVNVTFSSSFSITIRRSSPSSSYRSDGNDICPCCSSVVILIYRERKREAMKKKKTREKCMYMHIFAFSCKKKVFKCKFKKIY